MPTYSIPNTMGKLKVRHFAFIPHGYDENTASTILDADTAENHTNF